MTNTKIRDIVKRLNQQKRKMVLLKVENEKYTEEDINHCAAEIDKLTAEYNRAINSLSLDIWEEKCIYLFWKKNYTWKKIAKIITGRTDTAGALRKRCSQYKW